MAVIVLEQRCKKCGSTGVACQKLKRKFIGIEKDKKYFKIAAKRLKGEKQCK